MPPPAGYTFDNPETALNQRLHSMHFRHLDVHADEVIRSGFGKGNAKCFHDSSYVRVPRQSGVSVPTIERIGMRLIRNCLSGRKFLNPLHRTAYRALLQP